MRLPSRLLPSTRARGGLAVRFFAPSAIPPYGTPASYRRICGDLQTLSFPVSQNQTLSLPFRPHALAFSSLAASYSLSRAFASSAFRFQDQRQGENVRDPPRSKGSTTDAAGGERAKPSSEAKTEGSSSGPTEDPLGHNPEESSSKKSKDSSEEGQGESNERGERNEEKKEEPPPPPPHGDKTPWQVFTETLKSEFQASKEWNESTKALASSAHQFTENESVKRARAAYSAASGAATSTTSSAFRGTGKALGQGAAWTWDTSVVKGVRSGVKATGRGIEKATRPVRETKVYKTTVGGVKDVIDDGSSSRYGGWVEKEERRKKRELRELNEAGSGGTGRPGEKIEEDPKQVIFSLKFP